MLTFRKLRRSRQRKRLPTPLSPSIEGLRRKIPRLAGLRQKLPLLSCERIREAAESWQGTGYFFKSEPALDTSRSFFCPLIDPIIDRLVPELRILRLQDPVAFIGKVEH